MEESKLLLAELYTAYFNRAPDAAGLAYWVGELEGGVMNFDQIASNWANEQPEFTDTYGEDVDSDALITQVYANVLGREPDVDGAAYWSAELSNGNIPMNQFIQAIVNGAKAASGSASDATLLSNKAQVGVTMADSGINDLAFAAQVVATVTADQSTVGIVESIITMAAADTAGLANATSTLASVQVILTDTDSAATLTTTLANLKTVMQNLTEDIAAGTVTDIAATLTAATATVEAATQDASFVAEPETLANSIATNPTVVKESAAAVVEEAATPTESTTPTTTPSSGGSSTPAPTFTASVDENGTITFSGTATGNITMNGGDSDVGDTQDVTFTRGGVTTGTVTLDADSEVSVASGQTYVNTAAQADGAAIEGAGTVNITGLEDVLDADLSGITATTVTATVVGTDISTPLNMETNFGKAVVTLTEGSIGIAGLVTLGTASFIVDAGATLRVEQGLISGLNVTGEGNVYANFDGTNNDADLSNVQVEGGTSARVIGNADLSQNTTLDNVNVFSVWETNYTLTLTAEQAANAQIVNVGSVIIKDIDSTTDFTNTTIADTLAVVEGVVSTTADLTSVDLSKLTALTVDDGADTVITATVTPEQYAALVGKVTLGTNDTLISTDTTIPTSTIASAAFDENTGTLTLTGANFDTILETTEDATTDVKARLDWSKLSWDINGDDTTTADVSFEVSDIGSAKVTDATTLTITLTNTKTAALIATTGYNETGSSAVDTLDVSAGFIRDMSHNAATTDAATDAAVVITQDSAAPTITSVTVADGTYKIGDAVAVTVTAGNDETGLTLAGTFNGQTLTAITDNGDGTYTGTYTVVSGDAGVADEGSVTTSITLTDAASNASAATTSVTLSGESIDATAPTAPTGVTLTPSGGTVVENTLNGTNTNLTASATITAGEATGGSAVLKVDGTTIATDSTIASDDTTVSFDIGTSETSALQAAVAAGGTVTVEAIDAVGNATASTVSNPTLTVDYMAPSVTLTYSTDGGSTYSSTIDTRDADTLKIKATFNEAIDDTAGATIAIDNSVLEATAMTKTSTTEYYYDLDVPSGDIAAASVTIGAAKDAAGNTIIAAPTNPTFAIDNTATTTTISAIDISADTGTLDSDFITKTASQTITATLSAELIAGDIVYGSVDNGSTWTNITNKVSGTAISWDGTTLSGTSTIVLKVSDAAGNDGTPATQNYTLDTTAPTITAAPAVASETTISLTANENAIAGIYTVESALVGSAVSLTADQSGSITVAAQDTVTAGVIVVTDVAGNSTTSTSVGLGTTGEDYLLGDENANIIFGFNGNNTFNSGAGNDILYGGSDQDSFQFTSENFDSGKTINGGGTDAFNSIYITDAATIIDEDFTNVTDVGQIDLTGGLTHSITLGTNASSAFTYTGATNKLGIGIMNGETATSLTVDASAVTIGITVSNKPNSGDAGITEVTGGSGDDMFIFGATGASTVHFAATATDNGDDNIYIAEAASNVTLDFSSFLTTVSANTTAVDFTSGLDLTTNNLGIVYNKLLLGSDDIATSAEASKIAVLDNGKAVVFCADVTDTSTDDTSWGIYYIEDTDSSGGQTWEVTLVGQVYADGTGATATEIETITFA
ncbi:MAG: DUF4214 domain-containing protein [Sulfurimonas sp.]|uniref:DUF4214 domain-containing protein n=1 Tax=Sulfurimonas sp. TaxID=2022749 RepID=UPI003D0E4A58